jgi:predicted dehydrogenase
MAFKLGVIGIDHGHIFGMLGQMKAQGCICDAYWTDGPAVTEAKFNETFPEVAKVADRRRILDDPAIRMILISAVYADRAALAIEAMEAGKDVMVDKPGCTTLEQLAA